MARRRKRLLIAAAVVLAVVATAVVVAKVKIDRVEREAYLLAETGKGAIDLLKEIGASLKEGDRERLLGVYADDFHDAEPGVWRERLRSAHHQEEPDVALASTGGTDGDNAPGVRIYDWAVEADESGATGAGAAAERLMALVDGVETLEMAKLKLARVEEIVSPTEAVVRAVLWMRGERAIGDGGLAFESQAALRLHLEDSGRGYRIVGQELLAGRTVTGRRQGFTDVTEAAGLSHRAFQNPKFSTDEWRPERFGILPYGSAGVSTADFDGDGFYDVFFGDGRTARLYRNLGDGTFSDVTAGVGIDSELGGVNVAVFADLDNDGDQDLFLGRFTDPHLLYENDGDGTFSDVTDGAGLGGLFTTVAAAGDVDGDGLLDLYLGRYLDPRVDLPTTLFYTRNSQGNVLLKNGGDLRFTDVTAEAGVREGGLTLGVAFADYDHDGDQDLYVANDFGRNALFRNRGDGTFDDVSEETGTLDFGYGMSATWNDVDNDGDLDLYTSNVHSGQRWYGQAPSLSQYLVTSVRQGTMRQDLPLYREIFGYAGGDWKDYGDRMVKGNSLLVNDGSGGFTDRSEAANSNPFGWYWGATFLDYDNDGWQDIYVANGWITAHSHDDL